MSTTETMIESPLARLSDEEIEEIGREFQEIHDEVFAELGERDAKYIRSIIALHRRLAYVPGEVTLWPNLTGGEVIDLLLRLRGRPDGTRKAELLERFELDPNRKTALQLRDQVRRFRHVERARGDEQDVIGPDHAVFRIHRRSLDDRQDVALHALAADVGTATPGGTFAARTVRTTAWVTSSFSLGSVIDGGSTSTRAPSGRCSRARAICTSARVSSGWSCIR